MFWKEDIEDLVLSKRRRLTTILNNLDEMENTYVKGILSYAIRRKEEKYSNPDEFIKEMDANITDAMRGYGMLRNMFVEYYYPDAETKGYYDVYPSEDEE